MLISHLKSIVLTKVAAKIAALIAALLTCWVLASWFLMEEIVTSMISESYQEGLREANTQVDSVSAKIANDV
ncbi:MAG: hypothetical protein Q8O31_06565, partial [Rhodocyclaceae bacterium]|nr:hypothetical protein [Rhodocyclaceae bacterium]